jgi:inorganic pyrophosphatase
VRPHQRCAWLARGLLLAGLCACSVERIDETRDGPSATPAIASADADSSGAVDLLRTPAAIDSSGNITVVVEIPAGTNDKWEVNKHTGQLEWERRDGRPRVVAFLPYPGNYGFVPRTLLSRDSGGDGDPLDVLLLGPALPRGSVIPARLIGVLRMYDGGEADDKLIAVTQDGPFAQVRSVRDLRRSHPGALELISGWFSAYKGPGVVEVRGVADRDEAMTILQQAIAAFVPD